MAWLWWLLAPIVSTVLGALALAGRSRRETRFGGGGQDAMTQHRQLIEALQRSAPAGAEPLTMIVLDGQRDSALPTT